MKLRILMLSCLALMCVHMAASATELDLNDMTLEQLYAAREAIDARIDALEQHGSVQSYDGGSYLIGRDIPAGEYVLVENENAVFASVIVREGVTADSRLMVHHLINRQAVVRLNEGERLTLTEARAYALNQAPASASEPGNEGGYLVGVTLPAGRYDVSMIDRAPLSSYSVYDGVLGTDERLLRFEVIRETTEITLNEGEYIELSGCCLAPAEGF